MQRYLLLTEQVNKPKITLREDADDCYNYISADKERQRLLDGFAKGNAGEF